MPDSDNPWNRPVLSSIPNRPGDSTSEPLFNAIGRSISAWENLNATIVDLFCALSPSTYPQEITIPLRDTIPDTINQRIKSIESATEQRRHLIETDRLDEFDTLISDIQREMLAYKGWSQRRNEIAHGAVTAADAPDYQKIGHPITTTYSLLPSHRKDSKWLNTEPEYNYTSNEIELFAKNFSN